MKVHLKITYSLIIVFLLPVILFAQIEFTEHTVNDEYVGPRCVFASDIDSDGDLDLVAAFYSASDLIWFENDGDDEFTDHVVDEDYPGALTASAADLDGDDDIDLISTAYSDSTVGWFENDGDQEFELHLITTTVPSPHGLYTTDIDGDDDVDIIVASNQGNAVILWTNDGTGTFEQHTVGTTTGPLSVFAADVDSDDDVDILSASQGTNSINWWENDGDLNFTIHTVATNFMQARSVFAADLDSDGDMDVLGAATVSDDITWWENNGEEVFTQNIINGNFDGAYNVHAADLDDDGDMDVLGAAYQAADVAWWANDGEENFTQYTLNGNVTGASWVIASDLDGDDDLDVIATATNMDEIIWWEHLIPDASLSGTVTDSATGEPVEGAVISFGLFTDTTDADGIYGTEDFYSGVYTVTIVTEGYFDFEQEDVEVEEGANERNFAIEILTSHITGEVTDDMTNESITGATVTITNSETGERFAEIDTDDEGLYRKDSLLVDVIYFVRATHESYVPSDTEEVLIHLGGNDQDFELTPIFELNIQQLQTEQDVDTWVRTTGIVTQGTNVTDTEITEMFIQDETGWGVQIYDGNPWDPENNVNRGDEINIVGFLVEVDDVTRITDFELEVVGNDHPMPEPLVESTGDMAGATQREGTWGQISGQRNRDPPGEGDYTLVVDDGSGQCEIRIIENTGIDLTEFSANDWGTFTGVIGLSRQGLRIVPNIQEDVLTLAIDPPTDLTAEQELIPGDTLKLEVTLSWGHDHLDDWLRFKIYRDDEHVGNTQELTWTDTIADPNPGEYETYTWIYTITAVYDEGESGHSDEAEVTWDITSVNERSFSGIPAEWALEAVYPNPFNPELTIVVALPDQSMLNVRIFNILGEQVAVIADESFLPGYKKFTFNGSELSSGIYFIHASVPEKMNVVRKVVLMR